MASIELQRTAWGKYHSECNFQFNIYDYPEYFDLTMIEKYGWYKAKNKGNNLNGISRDHIFSVKDGFVHRIDPKLISHPANCELKRHIDNQKKRTKSFITLEELEKKLATLIKNTA